MTIELWGRADVLEKGKRERSGSSGGSVRQEGGLTVSNWPVLDFVGLIG